MKKCEACGNVQIEAGDLVLHESRYKVVKAVRCNGFSVDLDYEGTHMYERVGLGDVELRGHVVGEKGSGDE